MVYKRAVLLLFASIALSLIIQSCTAPVSTEKQEQEDAQVAFIETLHMQKSDLEQYAIKRHNEASKLSIQAAQLTLAPIQKSATDMLLAYGYTDDMFADVDYDINSPQAIYIALALIKWERVNAEESGFSNALLNIIAPPAYAKSQIWECAKQAAGISFGIELFRQYRMQTISGKKMLIKMFTKVGAKYLGYVGLCRLYVVRMMLGTIILIVLIVLSVIMFFKTDSDKKYERSMNLVIAGVLLVILLYRVT